jgi:hypothetical protein
LSHSLFERESALLLSHSLFTKESALLLSHSLFERDSGTAAADVLVENERMVDRTTKTRVLKIMFFKRGLKEME